jgi:YD repeat-containing protein
MRRLVMPLLCLFMLAGCSLPAGSSTSPTPTPTPKSPLETALEDEIDGDTGETAEGRMQIRRAVMDYVAAHYPESKVAGISTLKYDDNSYLVCVDIPNGEQQHIERLVVKLYISDEGESYWKAGPFDAYLERDTDLQSPIAKSHNGRHGP